MTLKSSVVITVSRLKGPVLLRTNCNVDCSFTTWWLLFNFELSNVKDVAMNFSLEYLYWKMFAIIYVMFLELMNS